MPPRVQVDQTLNMSGQDDWPTKFPNFQICPTTCTPFSIPIFNLFPNPMIFSESIGLNCFSFLYSGS